jgi:hypothetical protein
MKIVGMLTFKEEVHGIVDPTCSSGTSSMKLVRNRNTAKVWRRLHKKTFASMLKGSRTIG